MSILASLFGGSVIGKVVDVVSGSISSWAERKRIRQQASIELEAKKATADIDWDQAQVKASENSWKDEFWTIILAIPLILVFIPGLNEYVARGFDALEHTPDWYKAAVGIAISASFGFRQFAKHMTRKSGQGSQEKDQ